jgi:hypothetical protein
MKKEAFTASKSKAREVGIEQKERSYKHSLYETMFYL